jgi:hypothetical protein
MSIYNRGTGRNKTLTRGQNSPTVILNENFVDEKGTERASVYTLQFSRRPVDGQVPSTQFPTITFATVTWTIDGNQIQRIISVANGQSLTGGGAGCTVSVNDATYVNPAQPDPIPQYVVTVTLTPGSRGTAGNPPLYFPSNHTTFPSNTQHPQNGSAGRLHPFVAGPPFLPANDNIAYFPIPKTSGCNSVQVTVGADTAADELLSDVLIQQVDVTGNIVKSYNNNDYTGFVPIDPRADSIQITNLSTSIYTWYGIAFGIDG